MYRVFRRLAKRLANVFVLLFDRAFSVHVQNENPIINVSRNALQSVTSDKVCWGAR